MSLSHFFVNLFCEYLCKTDMNAEALINHLINNEIKVYLMGFIYLEWNSMYQDDTRESKKEVPALWKDNEIKKKYGPQHVVVLGLLH